MNQSTLKKQKVELIVIDEDENDSRPVLNTQEEKKRDKIESYSSRFDTPNDNPLKQSKKPGSPKKKKRPSFQQNKTESRKLNEGATVFPPIAKDDKVEEEENEQWPKSLKQELQNARDWLGKHVHRMFDRKSEEFSTMNNILEKHPNYENWKFQEAEAFQVTRSPKKKALQVMVKFCDKKEWRQVSWKECFKTKVTTHSEKHKLTQAMRYAIRPQIQQFRNSHPLKECQVCHRSNSDRIEVDHDKTKSALFSHLRDEFLKLEKDVPKKFWFDQKASSYRISGQDEWVRKWQQFHQKRALFRFLCDDCNKKNR